MDTLIGAAGSASAGIIKDSDAAGFPRDVIEASRNAPVVVDFWAPWCGPCKQLGPMIERVVTEQKGKVKLVKINIDQNKVLASQLRVQSIPAVFAFAGGRVVDAFVGIQPESQIRQFVARLAAAMGKAEQSGDPAMEQFLKEARAAFEAGDSQKAAAMYSRVLDHDSQNGLALAGLARSAIALGEPDQARQMLDQLPEEMAKEPDVIAARAALALTDDLGETGDLQSLAQKASADPGDLQTGYDLACAQYARGQAEAAINTLLDSIGKDRDWKDAKARKLLLRIFDALGANHPLSQKGRRGLSAVLFS